MALKFVELCENFGRDQRGLLVRTSLTASSQVGVVKLPEQLTREHPLIPVIIATGRPNQVFTAFHAGAGALLEKPMDIPTLLRATERLLAETATQRLARLVGTNTVFHYKAGSAA